MNPPRVIALPLLVVLLSAQDDDPTLPTAQDTEVTMALTVDQAVRIALGRNLDVQISQVASEISRYDELGSWGAFNWVFNASTGFADSEREIGGFLDGGSGTSIESQQTDYDFSFLRPLETGGSFQASFSRGTSESTSNLQNDPEQTTDNLAFVYTQPLMRGAWSEYSTLVQRENEIFWRRQLQVQRQTRQVVAQQVADAYWDLVSANEQYEVAVSGVELGESRLDREQRELDAGLGTGVDVVQAQATLAIRHQELLRTRNEVEQRQDDLRKLLFAGEEASLWEVLIVTSTGLPEVISTESVPTWTTAVATALDRRPELAQKRLDLDAARLNLTGAQSERRAGLDLQLSVTSRAVDGSSSQSLEDAFSMEFASYGALLSYNLPLGNTTARYAERSARARIRQAQLDYTKSELDVVAEVRAAVRLVHYAAEQVTASIESLRLARRQLDAEEALQRNDLSTTFQVLEFQQSLIEAMSNERLARAGFAKALVALESVQGLFGEN